MKRTSALLEDSEEDRLHTKVYRLAHRTNARSVLIRSLLTFKEF